MYYGQVEISGQKLLGIFLRLYSQRRILSLPCNSMIHLSCIMVFQCQMSKFIRGYIVHILVFVDLRIKSDVSFIWPLGDYGSVETRVRLDAYMIFMLNASMRANGCIG